MGVCVTQFDPKQLERGLVCSPGALPTINAAVISAQKIPYFKGSASTKAKFHITMGHETVMGRLSFFGVYKSDVPDFTPSANEFNFDLKYKHQDELLDMKSDSENELPLQQFALVELEKPVTCDHHSLVIGSKLDTDIHANICRLAFNGVLLDSSTDPKYAESFMPRVKVYKNKMREGIVERKVDDYSVICRGLFKKESNMEMFIGLRVELSSGEKGLIEGSFGQSGKFKVRIPGGLQIIFTFTLTSTRIITFLSAL